MTPTLLYRLYVALMAAALPFLWRTRRKRLMSDGVSEDRAREVLGYATEARPDGRLIWFHAASVGESQSVLSLITQLGETLPDTSFLITSGTPTSARLIEARKPERTLHQFAPIDAPAPVQRFLKHWRPDALILVESELWPNMMHATAKSGASLALVGARLSAKSLRSWSKRPNTFRFITQDLRLCIAQNTEMADALGNLGIPADRLIVGGNLKALSPALPVDSDEAQSLEDTLAKSPTWVAASTHDGEEETVLAAHEALVQTIPSARLILVPRHPERRVQVANLLDRSGLSWSQRSVGAPLNKQIYLADTLGEMGLWYSLAPIVFLGGSLLPIGGHNPYEVAHGGAAILTGPFVDNFSETYDAFAAAGAAQTVSDPQELAKALGHLLQDGTALATARAAARAMVTQQNDKLSSLADRLIAALELEHA